jgi:hypothetical protein
MAPGKKTKQTLLRISDFVADPSRATLKKHKKLEKQMLPYITGKGTVDKKKKKRIADEKEIKKGGEKWRSYLVGTGVTNVDESFSELLYLSNGRNPPMSYAEETDDRDEIESDDKDEIESDDTDSRGVIVDTLDDV